MMGVKGPYGQWFRGVDGRHGAEVADAAYQSARKHLLQSHDSENNEQQLLSRLSATSIEDRTREVAEVAVIGSQAENRNMRAHRDTKLEDIISTLEAANREGRTQDNGLLHVAHRLASSEREYVKKLDLVISLLHATESTIDDLLKRMNAKNAMQTSAQLDTNQRLSDLQLSQALSTFSLTFQEPQDSYRRQIVLRNRRKSGMGAKRPTNEFWLSPKLKTFSSDQQSSLIIMKGHFTTRWAMQDFGIDAITNLRATGNSVIWALPGASKHSSQTSWSSIDLIKYLVWQVLRLHNPTEKQMTIRCSQFQTAQTVGDWIELFKDILNTLQGRAYVVIDLSTLKASLATTDSPNLLQELDKMVRATTEAGMAARLKIILLLYEVDWFRLVPSTLGGSVVAVKTASSQKAPRRPVRQHAFTKGSLQRANRES